MKIKIIRSKWPWGKPDVKIDYTEQDGYINIDGHRFVDMVTATKRPEPVDAFFDNKSMEVGVAGEKMEEGDLVYKTVGDNKFFKVNK